VVTINAVKTQASARIPSDILSGIDIKLIDGHQIAAGEAIAQGG